ncbi:class I SAM-dependent methyltransferase [Iamia sp. SCSIO 61187]|uniref:class I SAM-dependent methyltransferase n=1 Tax=Iamia sp. SCSIO 61187 TaxID=2722752 RepID=UPI001C63153D|nr:class I SAM-dependent methyltransferase [Iamia sp. SCSIO 61187]QYG95280.1 class I SAM-dependent methyltransferase [Iamia sp. SCSIO 61187]
MTDAPPGRAWSRPTAAGPDGQTLPTDVATYGPGLPTEAELRLLGSLEGKRVLDLGCGAGHAAVAFARAGAKVIAVDPSADQLDMARDAADRAGVKVELVQAGPAELAFVRGDGIDLAWSAYALAEAPDLDRVFRQVHRVLRHEAPIVFALPHPAFTMFVAGRQSLEGSTGSPPVPRRTYHDATPYTVDRGGDRVTDTPRTISTLFTSLTRIGFRVDHLLEPPAQRDQVPAGAWVEAMAWVPPTLVLRARKQGI